VIRSGFSNFVAGGFPVVAGIDLAATDYVMAYRPVLA